MTDYKSKIPFPLGQIVATPGALEALEKHKCLPVTLLQRHISGDWGDLEPEDIAANNDALINDDRLFSSYKIAEGVKIWIITEWDRSATTLLLPSEY
jgi:hypothetical protein